MKKIVFTFFFLLIFYLTPNAQDLPILITDLTKNHFKVTNTGSKTLELYIGSENDEEVFSEDKVKNYDAFFKRKKYLINNLLTCQLYCYV